MEIFMRKIKKGSFTVEAALLMPVIFLVLMGLLYLNFYVHNRAWLTAGKNVGKCRAARWRKPSYADKYR